jgi:hypothetical protein
MVFLGYLLISGVNSAPLVGFRAVLRPRFLYTEDVFLWRKLVYKERLYFLREKVRTFENSAATSRMKGSKYAKQKHRLSRQNPKVTSFQNNKIY